MRRPEPMMRTVEIVDALRAWAGRLSKDDPQHWILDDAATVIEREVLHRNVDRGQRLGAPNSYDSFSTDEPTLYERPRR